MSIIINGVGELAMFLKNNPKLVQHELFPKTLSKFIPLFESVKKGCKCHHRQKIKSINYSFSTLEINEEETQNLKELFPEGFELVGKVKV